MSRTTIATSAFLALLVGVAAFVAAPAATAAGPPPKPKSSAVSQYVEMVPTSRGSTAPGIDTPTTKPLPEETLSALRAAVPASASALEAIATSSAYGAPTTTLPKPNPRPGGTTTGLREETPAAHGSPPPAVSGTSLAAGIEAAGAGGRQILLFGLALLALSVAMVATAARRREF